MSVCQTCGDKGDVKCLVYCAKCRVSCQHSYCLNIFPIKDDKNAISTCEECCQRNTKPSPTPIRSTRISHAVETRLNRIKMRKQTVSSKVIPQTYRDVDRLSNIKPTGDCSCQKEEMEWIPSFSHSARNEELKKPKRRLKLEDGSSDEESEPVKGSEVEHSQLEPVVSFYPPNILNKISYSDAKEYIPSQPINDPIWRGSFRIKHNKNPTFIGLTAHLSSKACTKVEDAAKALPMQLNLATFPRLEVWPLRFQISPPSDCDIALYLFPEHERDEKFFDDLLDDIIMHDQALKAVLNNVELLVFSSRELPPEHWRKLYIVVARSLEVLQEITTVKGIWRCKKTKSKPIPAV
ncbi:hypothetical protein JCGZ_22234 [Jatropha curcas]|uniref:AIPP2-like SPOC-like domain-containing protein n=1 Tax=Jatropha curcas TaxID=180498 RepID=A0A067JTI7_JATCU|nr:hypothetical protein JCGZ_22234 [Jatropha curcas]